MRLLVDTSASMGDARQARAGRAPGRRDRVRRARAPRHRDPAHRAGGGPARRFTGRHATGPLFADARRRSTPPGRPTSSARSRDVLARPGPRRRHCRDLRPAQRGLGRRDRPARRPAAATRSCSTSSPTRSCDPDLRGDLDMVDVETGQEVPVEPVAGSAPRVRRARRALARRDVGALRAARRRRPTSASWPTTPLEDVLLRGWREQGLVAVRFANPAGLGLLALAIPVILMHILRPRRLPVTVSSTMLWRKLERPVAAATPWQQLRWSLLLLAQLLAVAGLALAVARPERVEASPLSQHTVFIIDASGVDGRHRRLTRPTRRRRRPRRRAPRRAPGRRHGLDRGRGQHAAGRAHGVDRLRRVRARPAHDRSVGRPSRLRRRLRARREPRHRQHADRLRVPHRRRPRRHRGAAAPPGTRVRADRQRRHQPGDHASHRRQPRAPGSTPGCRSRNTGGAAVTQTVRVDVDGVTAGDPGRVAGHAASRPTSSSTSPRATASRRSSRAATCCRRRPRVRRGQAGERRAGAARRRHAVLGAAARVDPGVTVDPGHPREHRRNGRRRLRPGDLQRRRCAGRSGRAVHRHRPARRSAPPDRRRRPGDATGEEITSTATSNARP